MIKLANLTRSIALGMAAMALSHAANAAVVYQSPVSPNLYDNNQIGFAPCCGPLPGGMSGPFSVGNTITLSSGPTLLSNVTLFGYAGGGSKPIEVSLYAGSNPNTASLLGSAQVIPTGNGFTTEVFNFGALLVPKTLTFIVGIVGNNGSYDDSFVNWQQFTGIAGSPTTGASGDMWYGNAGNFVADNDYAMNTGAETNTLAVQFNSLDLTAAVPEPSTWAMMIFGFAGVGFVAYRRRQPGTQMLSSVA